MRTQNGCAPSCCRAPHLSPPRLIGNTGEPAEFVLPLENPNAPPGTKMADFTHDAISWTLTAHEARPGHELQFAKMMENGVSIPRAVFAFNSANVEGWALYAEAPVKQHLTLRGKVEMALGERFDPLSNHDFIIDQGMLPPYLLEQAVIEQYVPSRLAARGAAAAN